MTILYAMFFSLSCSHCFVSILFHFGAEILTAVSSPFFFFFVFFFVIIDVRSFDIFYANCCYSVFECKYELYSPIQKPKYGLRGNSFGTWTKKKYLYITRFLFWRWQRQPNRNESKVSSFFFFLLAFLLLLLLHLLLHKPFKKLLSLYRFNLLLRLILLFPLTVNWFRFHRWELVYFLKYLKISSANTATTNRFWNVKWMKTVSIFIYHKWKRKREEKRNITKIIFPM